MNTLTELLSSSWTQALGWTLLHSLWQSLLCIIVVIGILRFIPSKYSTQRYAVATAGLLIIFLSALGTFLYLTATHKVESFSQQIVMQQQPSVVSNPAAFSFTTILEIGRLWIQANIPLIVILWSVGAVLFSLRVFGGWWFIKKLRDQAFIIDGELSEELQRLAEKLNINRFVSLAESSIINAPVVIGYLRPMILMPMGMCAGLSTEQLESILIHELVHIRRGDYFMNLVQSLLEAVFFFNPFVWIISGIMRREREHCCDDTVVSVHGNPLAYARALATLEEVRLSKSGLALSLAENKNQLLNRIKRIMEKSVQHYSGRERMVPLLLLVVGLICASWLTIQSGQRDMLKGSERYDEQFVAADTSIKDKKSSYYRKEVVTNDEEGEPDVEVVEEFDGDLNAFSMHFNINVPDAPDAPDFSLNFLAPPVPDFNFNFIAPPVLDFEGFDVEIPEMPEPPEFVMMMEMDTTPHGNMRWHTGPDVEAFSQAFEEKFKAEFSDFYQKHEKELKKMMENVEVEVNENADHNVHEKIQALIDQQEQLARMQMKKEVVKSQKEAYKAQNFATIEDVQARKAEEMAKRSETVNTQQVAKLEKNMKKMEEKMKAMEKRHKALEKVMKEELVKDGYLGKDETLNNIDIDNDRIEINGKKIKSSDEEKYRKLVKEFEHADDMMDFEGRKE